MLVPRSPLHIHSPSSPDPVPSPPRTHRHRHRHHQLEPGFLPPNARLQSDKRTLTTPSSKTATPFLRAHPRPPQPESRGARRPATPSDRTLAPIRTEDHCCRNRSRNRRSVRMHTPSWPRIGDRAVLLTHRSSPMPRGGFEDVHVAYRRRVASPGGTPPLTLSVCCSSPATMAVRHLAGMPHVETARAFWGVGSSGSPTRPP
jgi:hypothetical protein